VLEHVTRGIGFEHCFDNGVLNAGVLGIVALVVIDPDNGLGFGSPSSSSSDSNCRPSNAARTFSISARA